MAFSNTWDLEKYKTEFESDEHWKLRKKFMEVHKDKFPEDKLVCLARVFFNVEFLGCRYPEKTMKLVAELSKGVADEHREKQKGKLKRTFVQASDAAGAKIKGTGAVPVNKQTEEPSRKVLKTSESDPTSAGFKYTCFVHADLVKPPTISEGEFPGFIIYENCKTNCPINILTQSSQKNQKWNTISFEFPQDKNPTPNMERYCEITLNQKVLSSGVGSTNKEAKVKAATEGLNKLQKTCYTIQEKLSFFTDGELVSKDQVVKGKAAQTPLPQDNIGSRMMMKMGWTGAGLGKNQQGIQNPIEASQTMHRTGFGHLSTPQFHAKFRKVFQDYIASGSSNDLVFAPDFTADERKILHKSSEDVENDKEDVELAGQGVDEDTGEDLFGLNTDNEVNCPISYDNDMEENTRDNETVPKTCEVCCNLESLTGEEIDDDLFDLIWGTSSDTSGLVDISQGIQTFYGEGVKNKYDNNETDNEICQMEFTDSVSANEIASPSNKSRILKNIEHFRKDEPTSLLNDIEINKRLACQVHDFNTHGSDVESLLNSRVNTVVSNLNQIWEQRASNQQTPFLFPPPILHQATFPSLSGQTPFPSVLNKPNFPQKIKRYRKKRVRLFLPNGSFKRITSSVVNANKELREFVEKSQTLNISVTSRDLTTNKSLRDLFPEFALEPECDEGLLSALDNENENLDEITSNNSRDLTTKTTTVPDVEVKCDLPGDHGSIQLEPTSHAVLHQTTFPSLSGQTSFPSSLNKPNFSTKKKRLRRKRVRVFLPNGSFKRIAVSVFNANIELRKFIEKSHMSTITVTNKDLTTNKSLRDLFPELPSKFECDEGSQSALDHQPTTEPSIISDGEVKYGLSREHSNVELEATSQFLPGHQPKGYKGVQENTLHFTLADGSTVEINFNCLKSNKYYIRYIYREKRILNYAYKPDEIPPPEYSDSSSDESETDWVPKSKLNISEPKDCELDKVHILRRRWEQFIIKFSHSKRNPFAKRWQDFVDNIPPNINKTLCMKWTDFMMICHPGVAGRIPNSVLLPGHEAIEDPQTRGPTIPPCVSSRVDSNLITVYLACGSKMKVSKDLVLNNTTWTGKTPNQPSTYDSSNKIETNLDNMEI